MQDLIFVTLPGDGGEDIHIRVDTIHHIRAMSDPRKAFLGLANGQYQIVEMTPLEVIEKVADAVADSEVPF